jgi:hypothetical protein
MQHPLCPGAARSIGTAAHLETVLRSEILAAEARIVGRLAAHEKNVSALRHSIAELFDSLRVQIVTITDIESSRIALAHSDDVIERVLDVLDYLHGAAFEESETQAAAA